MTSSNSPTTSALVLTDVGKRFGGLAALDALGFSVPAQSIFGIMGPNGAGKTTLINVITGFYSIDAGRVELFGDDVTQQSPVQIASKGVARTYQNVRLFSGLTVEENIVSGMYLKRSTRAWQALLATPAERRERKETSEKARELMVRVGLDPAYALRAAETLSYGDQRRCEIARALASEPRLLLLDEPTAGMNATESTALGELFVSLREDGYTLLVVEHNMQVITRYCARAVVINFGQLLAEGTPEECIAREDVIEAYFGKRADAERIEALLRVRRDPGS